MLKLLAVAARELLLLARDRPGLLVLFFMPAILVIVITLVQDNVLRLTGQAPTQVLYLDLDGGVVGRKLAQQLTESGLQLVDPEAEQRETAAIQAAVADGTYRMGIVVPAGTSARVRQESARLMTKMTAGEAPELSGGLPVPVFFDPGILPSLRTGLNSRVAMALAAISVDQQLTQLNRVLDPLLAALPGQRAGSAGSVAELSELLKQPLLVADEQHGRGELPGSSPYDPVQQNVPAWALFGVFFTAIPIAGGLLQERTSGIWTRLMTLPVSPLTLIGGKLAAYLVICCCQFLLIGLIGTVVFPVAGLPAFTVSAPPASLLTVVLLSSLAACGYGILLGTLCTSYEQASTMGATSVVVAAALGGIMVPVYAMPPLMQWFSVVSPLNWGLNAFHDLLVRGETLASLSDDLVRLSLFSLVTLGLAAWKLRSCQ
ncbi:ABC transporter permease [Desulfofustis glycolicus]|nr:ABC transporter permease [Desulfofustis glycolicus]MCB2217415.1 ABC transporter permease [Desulfobulbaceae bacterium]